jgi:hypothetical protein
VGKFLEKSSFWSGDEVYCPRLGMTGAMKAYVTPGALPLPDSRPI